MREAFGAAVRRGDVASAAAVLTQLHVRDEVLRTEAQIAAVGSAAFVPSLARFRLQTLRHDAWFYGNHELVFFSATVRLQPAIIEWLYGARSSYAAPAIPQTLAFLLFGLLLQAVQEHNGPALELLLSSATFCHVLGDDHRRILLEDAMSRIGGACAERTISLLVAHGAVITTDDDLPVYGSRQLATASLLQHIATEGACFVGLQRVLHRMLVDSETLRALLQLGIDVRDDAVVDLRGTPNAESHDRLEIIRVLLAEALVDVDAQETTGRFADSGTPLIRAVRGLFSEREDETIAFIELLIRFGADARVPDRRGFAAIDYATMSASDTLFQALARLLTL